MAREIVLIIGVFLYSLIQAQNTNTRQDSIAFHQSSIEEGKVIHSNGQIMAHTAISASPDGSFTVGGNPNTYYPVVFQDNAWGKNRATILEIGRSNVHTDSSWTGSLIASFKFHLFRWGHAANFIDADIKQRKGVANNEKDFIGGWLDITGQNNTYNLIIWLKGAATYYYHANCNQAPIVTNTSVVIEGETYEIKTQKDEYINGNGQTINNDLWILGKSYFKGNVGIGTTTPKNKLDVAGTIRATEVKVETDWADFVFEKDYKLPSLEEVESHINEHKRLPDIPSEAQVKEEGVGLGEMQVKLLQKIEELTLYVIDLKKENQAQQRRIEELEKTNK